jgi:hypothetical protein
MGREKKEAIQEIAMSKSANGGDFYQVHGSGTIAQAIRQIHHRALREGRGREVAEALHLLKRRLQINPGNLGEPLYRLAALRMQVRTAVIGPLAVDFGVCEDRPVVFIKGVALLSKST